MSLFGSLMNDLDDDPIFGMHMRSMRQMNNMMNSLFADPFGMMNSFRTPALTAGGRAHDSLMPYDAFPAMPNISRLLSGSLDSLGDCHSYSSTSVVSMTSGPDGNPQVYRASSSTRVAPGGIKETQRTVCDSRTGTKKMSIGHHIGDRAHIVEREKNMRSGEEEERQDFINLEEEEADTFNREWETRTRSRSGIGRLPGAHGRHAQLALPPAPSTSQRRHRQSTPIVSSRRSLRSPTLALTASASPSLSANRSPYSPPGQAQVRKHRSMKSVSGNNSQ